MTLIARAVVVWSNWSVADQLKEHVRVASIPNPPQVIYRRTRLDDKDAVLRVLAHANMHNVPSPEMPELLLENFFVAELDGVVIGCAGFTVLRDGRGKTTLMAVDPAHRGLGLGQRLQELRMLEMRERGCKAIVTNADRPETIDWYKRKFGYEEVGTLPKEHEFGDPDVDQWTTLEADIERWHKELYQGPTHPPAERTPT